MSSPLGSFQHLWRDEPVKSGGTREPARPKRPTRSERQRQVQEGLTRLEGLYRAVMHQIDELRKEQNAFREEQGLRAIGRPRARGDRSRPTKAERLDMIYERGSRW